MSLVQNKELDPYGLVRLASICYSTPQLPDNVLMDESGSYDLGIMMQPFPRSIFASPDAPFIMPRNKRGFPQGAPISPLLTIYSLSRSLQILFPEAELYADDGLIFDVPEEEIALRLRDPILKEAGVKIHPTKSRMIKKNGIWLHPLKFLGLTYDPVTDNLESSVRSLQGAKGLPIPQKFHTLMGLYSLNRGRILNSLRSVVYQYLPFLRPTERLQIDPSFLSSLLTFNESLNLHQGSKHTLPEGYE